MLTPPHDGRNNVVFCPRFATVCWTTLSPLSSLGDIECVSAKERGYMVCPIASLAGARIVSSFSKMEAIWESNLSGDKSRRDGGKGEGDWAGSLLTGCGGLLAKDEEAAGDFLAATE